MREKLSSSSSAWGFSFFAGGKHSPGSTKAGWRVRWKAGTKAEDCCAFSPSPSFFLLVKKSLRMSECPSALCCFRLPEWRKGCEHKTNILLRLRSVLPCQEHRSLVVVLIVLALLLGNRESVQRNPGGNKTGPSSLCPVLLSPVFFFVSLSPIVCSFSICCAALSLSSGSV